MQRINIYITCALAGLSLFYWFAIAIIPNHILISYPEVQVPLGLGLLGMTTLGWWMVWRSDRNEYGVTRCRICRHILRGLSAPRCPECGESI